MEDAPRQAHVYQVSIRKERQTLKICRSSDPGGRKSTQVLLASAETVTLSGPDSNGRQWYFCTPARDPSCRLVLSRAKLLYA